MTTEVAEPEPEPTDHLSPETLEHYDTKHLPKYIDCGDKRPLTPECQQDRTEDPARYFGGAYGLGLITLLSVAAHSSSPYRTTRRTLTDFGGLAGLSSAISHKAHAEDVQVHVHSAEPIEEHPTRIQADKQAPLGCAFMANLGSVLANFHHPTVQDTAHHIAINSPHNSFLGCVDIDGILENVPPVLMALGNRRYSIDRSTLMSWIDNQRRHTPVAMLQGQPNITEGTRVVLDMTGYKIPADGKNYIHSVPLPEVLLPKVMNGYANLNPHVLNCSSLLLGLATQQTLGVQNLEQLREETGLTRV